ncbi:small heat shock protein [Trichuris trichiura]|uniref:Small heat shock protein n=1 Tax=Trichuris trichiura TaxID=36087 RepID=A0A077ZA52_TRITR|nr:small heat shock protein [Trichuris trichiura]
MALHIWTRSPCWDDRINPCFPRRDMFGEINRMARHVENLSRAKLAPFTYDEMPVIGSAEREISSVVNDEKKFQVSLDVKHFKPEELEVTIKDNQLIIHGKHEENKDEHGFVKREFTRAYWLPEGIKPENFKSNLSAEGVLTIEAPKFAAVQPGKHSIPIEMAKK